MKLHYKLCKSRHHCFQLGWTIFAMGCRVNCDSCRFWLEGSICLEHISVIVTVRTSKVCIFQMGMHHVGQKYIYGR